MVMKANCLKGYGIIEFDDNGMCPIARDVKGGCIKCDAPEKKEKGLSTPLVIQDKLKKDEDDF